MGVSVTPFVQRREPRLLRLFVAFFALAALAVLLAAGWVRFFVPTRHPARVRDITLLAQPGR
jgi:hypothetical protein